jgi:hypothetical protein
MFISNYDDDTIRPDDPGRDEAVTDVWARKSIVDLLAEAAHAEPTAKFVH